MISLVFRVVETSDKMCGVFVVVVVVVIIIIIKIIFRFIPCYFNNTGPIV
jgi:hypothetical protein